MATRFPVYQIDFNAVAAGKRVAATKRRVRWRFGFPNLQAVQAGRTGSECRGEEHEITIVWSVTSGKRQILMNGKEVHYSSTRAGILDHSWNVKGNHVMKVVCHASPPLSANPGFRQYDLFIDGQSFFSMPKIHEVGVRGTATPAATARVPARYDPPRGGSNMAQSSPRRQTSIDAPRTSVEEEEDLKRAISASLEESRRHLGENKTAPKPTQDFTSTPAPGTDLLGFGGGSAAPAASASPAIDYSDTMSYTSAPTYIAPTPAPLPVNNQAAMVLAPTQPASQFGMAPPAPPQQAYYAQPPAPPQPYMQQPPQPFAAAPAAPYVAPVAAATPPQQQTFSPPSNDNNFFTEPTSNTYGSPGSDQLAVGGHSFDDPFAPKPPSRDEVNANILNAYGGGNGAAGTPATPGGAAPGTMGAPAAGVGYATPTQPTVQNPHKNVVQTGTALQLAQEPDPNSLEGAMMKLVNFDHIDEPAEQKVKLTMKEKEDEETEKNKNKSKPLPPAGHRMMGTHATLSQISTVKPTKTGNENVMKAPPQLFNPNAAMAGALVVHGAPNQGPPPLPPRGVGYVHGQPQSYPPQMMQQPPQMQVAYGQQQPGYGQPAPMMQGQPGYPMQQPPPQQGYAPAYR